MYVRDMKLLGMFSTDIVSSSSYCGISWTPQQFSQAKLNDLVWDLALCKKASDVLASRLQENKSAWFICKRFFFRKMYEEFVEFFSKDKKLVYCHHLQGLLKKIKCHYMWHRMCCGYFWIVESTVWNVFYYIRIMYMQLYELAIQCICEKHMMI